MSDYSYLFNMLNHLNKIDEEKQLHVLTVNIAYGVMQKLYIQNDMTLIAVLGTGQEHSNHEALVHWMMNRYSMQSFKNMANVLCTVSTELHYYLEEELNGGGFSC